MAVRDALLALLTVGPAYGFALHGGLSLRTGGRRSVNVGQTYATLERLTKQGLIEPAGTTDDGLPLHRLTTAGGHAARAWLDGADAAGSDPWDETVDRVLIACSLPGWNAAETIEHERERWLERRAASAAAASTSPATGAAESDARATNGTAETGLARLAASAELTRAAAMLDWLGTAATAEGLAFEPSSERPRRGRRPAAIAPSSDAAPQASASA